MARYRARGTAGIVCGKRGKRSNNWLSAGYTDQVQASVREHYADFGRTFPREKLYERHGLCSQRLRDLPANRRCSQKPLEQPCR